MRAVYSVAASSVAPGACSSATLRPSLTSSPATRTASSIRGPATSRPARIVVSVRLTLLRTGTPETVVRRCVSWWGPG